MPRGRPSCAPLGRCASATGRDAHQSTTEHGGGDRAEVMIFFEKLFAPTLGLSRGRDETCDVRAGGRRRP